MKSKMTQAKLLCNRIDLLHNMPKFGTTCEVGVAFGDFSQQIIEICQPKKHYLIDSWAHQGRYDSTAYKSVFDKFSNYVESGRVEIIKCNSVDGIDILPDNSIDFIYIDTDHTYKTTKMELQASIKKMKPNGIISGHDYKAQGRYDYETKQLIPYGVVEAVQEFMVTRDYDLLYLTNEVDGFLSFALRASGASEVFSSKKYWEQRYHSGGNSGSGSYNRLATYKAEIINQFIQDKKINTVIEFGTGDGNQLSLLSIQNYIGFDVSRTIIEKLRIKFSNSEAKHLFHVDEYSGQTAELALSIDVIFHLVEDSVFNAYMERLFSSASKYVIVYSSNYESTTQAMHVRHRKFTQWIHKNKHAWKCIKYYKNKYPFNASDPDNTSFCDFYIFENTAY